MNSAFEFNKSEVFAVETYSIPNVIGWANVIVYFALFTLPAGTSITKLPSLFPAYGVALATADVVTNPVKASEKTPIATFPAVKVEVFIFTFPYDSVQFEIPSLSESKSILSLTPSLLKSSQLLTGIISDVKELPQLDKVAFT